MSNEIKRLEEIVSYNFGVEATAYSQVEEFYTSNVEDKDHGADSWHTENHCRFKLLLLDVGRDTFFRYYNLVICDEDFPNNRDLFDFMRYEDMIEAKDYELVQPIHDIKGYFLYKVIPYTVQGKPTWVNL